MTTARTQMPATNSARIARRAYDLGRGHTRRSRRYSDAPPDRLDQSADYLPGVAAASFRCLLSPSTTKPSSEHSGKRCLKALQGAIHSPPQELDPSVIGQVQMQRMGDRAGPKLGSLHGIPGDP